MKRYAIVRVDKYGNYLNSCPAGFEEINNDFVCSYKKDSILNQYVHNCKNCRYGDTKEQLIRKIAQVILRRFIKGYLGNAIKPKLAKEQIEIVYKNYLEMSKEIVEFLGVEE